MHLLRLLLEWEWGLMAIHKELNNLCIETEILHQTFTYTEFVEPSYQ